MLMERLIQSLREGIRTMDLLFNEVKVPNPTANTLIFHKSQKDNFYVTLQSQTPLLDGLISENEIDWICEIIANLNKINEKCFGKCLTFLDCTILTVTLVLILLPLVLGVVYGVPGFFVGLVFYITVVIILYFVKTLV